MLINNKNLDLVAEGSKQETRQGRDRRGNKNKVLGGPLELRLRLKVGAVCLRDAKGVTGHDARLRSQPTVAFSRRRPSSAPSLDELVAATCDNSKRISDLLVGVEHDSELRAHRSGRQVLLEDGAHRSALAVRGGDLAPDALVLEGGLGVVLSVNVRDALAVVEDAGAAVLAALDGDEGGVLFLRPLAALEAHENALGVESAAINNASESKESEFGKARSGSRVKLT